jgi:predicted small metal-binding protein
MAPIDTDQEPPGDSDPVCDCGYRSRGESLAARISDARHHAREAHGIEVTAHQVLNESRGATP